MVPEDKSGEKNAQAARACLPEEKSEWTAISLLPTRLFLVLYSRNGVSGEFVSREHLRFRDYTPTEAEFGVRSEQVALRQTDEDGKNRDFDIRVLSPACVHSCTNLFGNPWRYSLFADAAVRIDFKVLP